MAVHRGAERIKRVPRIVADAAIGAWIFAIGTVELLLGWNYRPGYGPSAVSILAIGALGVALRRIRPWTVFALVLASSIGGLFTNASFFGSFLALFVVLYTVSERAGGVVSVIGLLAAFVAHYLALVRTGNGPGDIPSLFLVDFAWLALAWFGGRARARCRTVRSELERTIGELEGERNRLARSSITLERERIARELHVMVVRGVERMNVLTCAARRHLASDAPESSRTIAGIEATGRRTLVEMRKLLLVLRRRHDTARSPEVCLATDDPAEPFPPSGGPLPSEPFPNFRHRSSDAQLAQQARRWVAIPRVADALVILVMAILAVAEPYVLPWPTDARTYVPTAVVVVGALLFRRRAPFLVLVVIAAIVFAENVGLKDHPFVADRALMVAIFTVAAAGGARWGALAVGIEVISFAPYLSDLHAGTVLVLGWTSQMVFAVIAGLDVREGRRLNRELEAQTDMLRRTREERIRRVVDEERLRVARDVHDMVAHGVTLMVIQAGAARRLADGDHVRADQALGSVERAGQEALRELHALVGKLGGVPPDGAEPLAEDEQLTIHSLVAEAIATGMRVELVIDGEPRKLDPGLELSLCRIVQEALTNVRKHAPGASTRVELQYTPEGVTVDVTDHGGPISVAQPQAVPGAGQGLVGISERAALFDGRAAVGRTADGGFRVHVSLTQERVSV